MDSFAHLRLAPGNVRRQGSHLFPNSIQTTDKEPALWAQFWADQGFTTNQVVYLKGLGDLSACDAQAGGSLESVSEVLSHPKVRIAGLVVDKVDKIMHGMEMGTAGMHNQVCQWAKQPYLNTLLDLLLDRGFRVYLTSDHGNIEAEGCGRPSEGAVAAPARRTSPRSIPTRSYAPR